MRLLSLDFDPVYGRDTVRGDFDGDLSAFDFDVVLWDPQGSFEHYKSYDQYMGLPALNDSRSVRIQEDVRRRRREFVDFINAGRTLVVIGRSPLPCYVATGEHTYSGTGRNRVDTRHVAQFDLLSALPGSAVKSMKARGSQIEFTDGGGAIDSFLRKYKPLFNYDAVFTEHPGHPLGTVKGTGRVVSFLQRSVGGGLFLVIPEPALRDVETDVEDTDEDRDAWIKEAPAFQGDLLDAIKAASGSGDATRPSWSDTHLTVNSRALRESVVKAQRSVERARAKLTTLQARHAEVILTEQLYLGTGRALELQVKEALERLGGSVTEPVPGRDDWKVKFPEGDLVVEVKGVAKSAAESHAAQLEKWVAGAIEEGGHPKGVLIVNAWKDKALAVRDRCKAFPDQMLPYSVSRKHCLMTGLQLFVIREDVEADSSRAAFWRRKILDADGVLTDVPDWRTVIDVTETSAS